MKNLPRASSMTVCRGRAATIPGALFLRRLAGGGCRIAPGIAASSIAFITGGMIAVAWWFGLHDSYPDMPASDAAMPQFHSRNQGPPPTGRLSVELGDKFPAWEAKGWLNGYAPTPRELKGKIVVVDIWNEL